MSEVFNIYCDESCHLQFDKYGVMVLGALECPASCVRGISEQIRDIKAAHSLARSFEVKWTKVSSGKADFYRRLVEFFFEEKDLRLRAILIPDKSVLDHEAHQQTHDDFYYKMFFRLLAPMIDPTACYRIYMDIKDTRSEEKRARLEQYLRNNKYDSTGDVIERVQQIRSHESELMQLVDLLIGAIGHLNRSISKGGAKHSIIQHIQQLSGKSLQQSTWPRESKFNLFVWNGKKGQPNE